ncbi:hypothetical protein, partial [Klebsiella aerogenes]|uniref:hypothetical protein n=1 Tax=Klebsiella aerogenes TaxID=548 RepID=UPI0013D6ACE1
RLQELPHKVGLPGRIGFGENAVEMGSRGVLGNAEASGGREQTFAAGNSGQQPSLGRRQIEASAKFRRAGLEIGGRVE